MRHTVRSISGYQIDDIIAGHVYGDRENVVEGNLFETKKGY
jgi:hypothetical protein